MSRHRRKWNDNDEHGNPMWEKWRNPYGNEHAPSAWKKLERRQERTKAKQHIRNGRFDMITKYERPYYW